jgi:hypothetical protein
MMALKAERANAGEGPAEVPAARDEGTERVMELLAEEWTTIQGLLGAAAMPRGGQPPAGLP